MIGPLRKMSLDLTGDMVINQHGLRQQLDTLGLHAITWANAAPYVCCHLDDIFRPQ